MKTTAAILPLPHGPRQMAVVQLNRFDAIDAALRVHALWQKDLLI
jgi:hypothetical protein